MASKNNTYFLVKDILNSFPYKVERNLISSLNNHHIFKKTTREILQEEVKNKKPNFNLLCGALIMQNAFLSKHPQVAFYEIIYVVSELKFCYFKDKRKTIKRLSGESILRLFVSLYFEFCMLPHKERSLSSVEKFKKYFSRDDIESVINNQNIFFPVRFIFERHGIDLGIREEPKRRIVKILDDFYNGRDFLSIKQSF